MRTFVATLCISCICVAAGAQGTIPEAKFVTAGGSQNGISYTLGQTFTQHAPAGASIPQITEGIQQAYFIEKIDTVILFPDELAPYTPGQNTIYTASAEGYDSLMHLQVYQFECPTTYDTTMAVSGHPTCHIDLTGIYAPTITPDEAVVNLTASPGNPYDYPVGDTSITTWTASVAGKTKSCPQKIIVRYYRCADLHPTVTDVDNYTYPVVNVGYYCWTGKNLRTVHYNDGSSEIPGVTTYPADRAPQIADMAETLGHLYTWDAAVNNSAQGICPTGWHIPTPTEAAYLSTFEATQLMSEDSHPHWLPSDGSDDYGFRLLPAGFYNSHTGYYEGLYVYAYFWTTEEQGSETAIACQFGAACATSEMTANRKYMGYSVRCVMDY